MKKRILQFVGSFNQGGSERQALALTRSLKDEGSYEIFAATLNKNGVLRRDFEAIGLAEIPEFPLTSFYNYNFIRQVRLCANYVRTQQIDLVHTHDFYTNVFGMAAARAGSIRVRVASKRETGGMRTQAQQYVEKIAFGRAQAIVANSNAVREGLISRGIADDKIRVIYNGTALIEPRQHHAAISDLVPAIRNGEPVITLVANLRHTVKNVPMLLHAAKRVIERDETVHFVIAGEGELRNELEGLAVRLGVARNTHFIGRCDDIPGLLAASYACVLTSSAEGFSNSLIEYMASGKPVVATDVGGAAEAIVDGETGFLVPSDDDAKLAERLVELLADRKQAVAMGNAGRRIATGKFSHQEQVKKTLELYNSLLKAS